MSESSVVLLLFIGMLFASGIPWEVTQELLDHFFPERRERKKE